MYLMLKIKVPTNIEKDFSAAILTSHQKKKQKKSNKQKPTTKP